MGENRHNLVKIKALLFLRMRKQSDHEWSGAGEIIQGTGANAGSLYVLLGRWAGWNLVERMDSTPFYYKITPVGERYLDKLKAWYKGGNIRDMATEVATASKAIFWWANLQYGRELEQIFYISAPLRGADNYSVVPMPPQPITKWDPPRDSLIAVRCATALEAAKTAFSYGLHVDRPFLQVLADAGHLYLKDEARA